MDNTVEKKSVDLSKVSFEQLSEELLNRKVFRESVSETAVARLEVWLCGECWTVRLCFDSSDRKRDISEGFGYVSEEAAVEGAGRIYKALARCEVGVAVRK